MTEKESTFIKMSGGTATPSVCLQRKIYNALSGDRKTLFAQTMVDMWNARLTGQMSSEDADKLIEQWRPASVPLDGKSPDGGNRKGVGKVKIGLVLQDMAGAIHAVAQVMTEGAKKHEPAGWKKVENGIYEYTEALNRHLNAEARGETRDPEWNFLHAAHAACCALIRLQLIMDKPEAVLPAGTVIENGFAMVPNEPLRFQVPTADGKYETLAGPVTPWVTLMRSVGARDPRYEVRHCALSDKPGAVRVTCMDSGPDAAGLVSFEAPIKRTEERSGMAAVAFFDALKGKKITDRDIGIYIGMIEP